MSAAALATLMAFSIVGALYVARDVLIPCALAALLSFLLAPPVRTLRRRGVPQGLAVTIVMLGALVFGAALGGLISGQARGLLDDLPRYEGNVREKIRAFRSWESNGGLFGRLRGTLSDLGDELTVKPKADLPQGPPPVLSNDAQRQQQPEPKPEAAPNAEAEQPPAEMSFSTVMGLVEPVLKPLADIGLVILFTIFILLQREDLRNRLIRLGGAGDLNRATAAMTDAGSRLARFFLLQALLNLSFGVIVALALWGLDMPAALGFGVFAALMRFVPYIGSVLAAIPPIAVAAAIEPGWSTAILVAAVFGIGEPLLGQVIEPVVFGRHTGLSPIAVVGAATFWTWLWGPIGLLLSTPLTLCLVVLGQHTRPLGFLAVLLSDEPALTPPEMFYQRLLAGDAAEVVWQAEASLKVTPLVTYYDDVVLPGLRMAVRDARAGHIDDERLGDVALALDDLVETLGDAELDLAPESLPVEAEAGSDQYIRADALWKERLEQCFPEGVPERWKAPGAIELYPGRGTLDFVSARMAADVLQKVGFGAEVRPRERSQRDYDSSRAPLLGVVASVGGLSLNELHLAQRRIEREGRIARVLGASFADDAEPPHGSGDGASLRQVRSLSALVTSVIEMTQQTVPETQENRVKATLKDIPNGVERTHA